MYSVYQGTCLFSLCKKYLQYVILNHQSSHKLEDFPSAMDILIMILYVVFGVSVFLLGFTSVLSLLKWLKIWEPAGINAYKLLLINVVIFFISILGLVLLYNIA